MTRHHMWGQDARPTITTEADSPGDEGALELALSMHWARPPGITIHREGVETVETIQRVKVAPGDVILLYTAQEKDAVAKVLTTGSFRAMNTSQSRMRLRGVSCK